MTNGYPATPRREPLGVHSSLPDATAPGFSFPEASLALGGWGRPRSPLDWSGGQSCPLDLAEKVGWALNLL